MSLLLCFGCYVYDDTVLLCTTPQQISGIDCEIEVIWQMYGISVADVVA